MADHYSITADELRSILHYDPLTGVFTRRESAGGRMAGKVSGGPTTDGYTKIGVNRRYYKAHRLAWLYVYGEWPTYQIDHINRDRADNRICNLRDVTHQQNLCNTNTYSNNTSGHKGVRYRNGKFAARIRVNYKFVQLGTFECFDEAVAARVAAERLYWPQLSL